jgi:hypothetical protein
MKEVKTVGARSTVVKMTDSYKILVRKPEEKRPLQRAKRET